MKKTAYMTVLVMVAIMVTVGCNRSNNAAVLSTQEAAIPAKVVKTAEQVKAEEKAMVKTIESYLDAWESEDLNKMADILYPGKDKADTLADASIIFDTYDGLKFKLLSYDYIGDGVIKVVHGTSGDPEKFRDNRATSDWTFKQYDGEWRLADTATPTIRFEDVIAKEEADAEAAAIAAAKAIADESKV